MCLACSPIAIHRESHIGDLKQRSVPGTHRRILAKLKTLCIMCIAQLCALRFQKVTAGFGIFHVFHMMNGRQSGVLRGSP